MDELRNKVKALLEAKTVNVVIGYEEGTGKKPRALFAVKPDDAAKLIYDSCCVLNLAAYVTKHEIKAKGKMAITATLPVMRSIIQLASEFQVNDNNLLVIGLTPDNKVIEFKNLAEVETFIHKFEISIDSKYKEALEKLDKMSRTDRWNWWINELAPLFQVLCLPCCMPDVLLPQMHGRFQPATMDPGPVT
jgi:hypothetical protein